MTGLRWQHPEMCRRDHPPRRRQDRAVGGGREPYPEIQAGDQRWPVAGRSGRTDLRLQPRRRWLAPARALEPAGTPDRRRPLSPRAGRRGPTRPAGRVRVPGQFHRLLHGLWLRPSRPVGVGPGRTVEDTEPLQRAVAPIHERVFPPAEAGQELLQSPGLIARFGVMYPRRIETAEWRGGVVASGGPTPGLQRCRMTESRKWTEASRRLQGVFPADHLPSDSGFSKERRFG